MTSYRVTMIPYDEDNAYVMEFDRRNLSWKDGLTLDEAKEIVEKQFKDWTIIKIENGSNDE